MLTVLLPIDGSETSLHAANYLIGRALQLKEPMSVVLLNVQPRYGTAPRPTGSGDPEEPLREEGKKVLAHARQVLEAAGIKHQHHVELGDPVEVIERYARIYHCDEIVMGTRGKTSILTLVVGSVTTKVLHVATVPVVLVK